MAISKFASMLATSSLWFARADQFKDAFEGSSPKINIAARQLPSYLSTKDASIFHNLMENTTLAKQHWVRYIAINCWQMNVAESTAMWDLYLPPTKDGLAVQSTFKNFKDSLRTEESVYIGKVIYIDYEHQVIEHESTLAPFLHKRKAFEHERELRAIIVRPPPPGTKGLNFGVETIERGIQVSVDLKLLISKVYIAPQAPIDLAANIKALIIKYGYNFEIKSSGLAEEPKF
ncbi:hypothetical protein DA01_07360 [Dehalococcoides mccartyi]|uniref:Uncharacterized protein n=1 Tax=Dehalococcoides mccartyi TaxID=61435 RepID=A0A0V8M0I1_9CHLR|nr:hypothetical protein [Dehalococcoides mccartyi]KSV17278.1 hypothetical protein DA01_07360 [Dehalococcoides mccartyi]